MTTLLFLALILTFEMLPVSPTTTSPTTTGEISIIEEGSLEAGSALILSCTIPDFTGSAQWGRDNNIYTTCLYAGFCSVVHTENYTFGSNASGIFVTINPLSMVDNGSIWMCSNQVYTTSYTVIVQTTIAPTTGKISINGIGSLEVDSVLTLSCIIPAFTGGATWRRGNINLVTCAFNSFCTIESTERYTFAGNNSGIFVTIYTLSMSDNGTKWICYDGDDSTSYTVFVQSTFVPLPGEYSIFGKGSFEAGSALLLSCIIPTFTGHALWYRDNVLYAYCTPDTCDTYSTMVNYTFASNTSGIFATIDPLSMTENGTEWNCNHNVFNTVYTVFLRK
ncbi:uncharacterized protein LOC143059316 [Mytilus galloprovincialis]|uniref:uncharacterized protein LOC143059316 n=1 Tax=Mytilus galloprovincialis TaxID=29158 RepID=UPI003F7C9437